jgi:hypothetical protein
VKSQFYVTESYLSRFKLTLPNILQGYLATPQLFVVLADQTDLPAPEHYLYKFWDPELQ